MVLASACCILVSSPCWGDEVTTRRELEALKQRIDQVISENRELIRRVGELEEAMRRQMQQGRQSDEGAGEGEVKEVEAGGSELAEREAAGEIAEEEAGKSEDWASKINEYLTFGGALEIETGWSENFERRSESDITLETAEVDFEVRVNEWTRGTLIVEWDNDEDTLSIDEAYVAFGNTERFPLSLKAKRAIASFGISTGYPVADTLSISDPSTIEAFETKKDLVGLRFTSEDFSVSGYAFNGDTNRGGGSQDHIEHGGASARYRLEGGDFFADFGMDFVSSVFDADGLTEFFPDALESNYIRGLAAHIRSRMGRFSLVGEYNGAVDTVEFEAGGEKWRIAPEAWQIQLGYMTIPSDDADEGTYLAIGYSVSEDLVEALPERRVLTTVGRWLYPGLVCFPEIKWAFQSRSRVIELKKESRRGAVLLTVLETRGNDQRSG